MTFRPLPIFATLVLGANLALVSACGSESSDDTGTSGTSGTSSTSGTSAAPTVTLTGQVIGVLNTEPIEGATVCLDGDATSCVASDSSGVFSIELPEDSDVTVTFSKTDFPTTYMPHHTTTQDLEWRLGMMSWAEADLQATLVDAKLDHSLGTLTFGLVDASAQGADVSGVAVSLSPEAGLGPILVDSDGLPSLKLTETGTGFGGWVNLPEGDYTVSFTYSGMSCAPTYAWSDASDTSISTIIHAEGISYMQLDCDL
ncbi:MAG: carboxypeptidase-like regulatory domain-containing protein [Oligoflexia bacterium]|nr:carboxypeptidase-like regulatory domain-containing protein [Oligoflexia bacterium]